jgi:hypothetical protein
VDSFKSSTAARLSVDLDEPLPTNGFSWVVHRAALFIDLMKRTMLVSKTPA